MHLYYTLLLICCKNNLFAVPIPENSGGSHPIPWLSGTNLIHTYIYSIYISKFDFRKPILLYILSMYCIVQYCLMDIR